MSIFRRAPVVHPKPRRYACEHCAWFAYDPDETLGHMFTSHLNRRIAASSPNPARRRDDSQAEWVRRARAGQLPPKRLS